MFSVRQIFVSIFIFTASLFFVGSVLLLSTQLLLGIIIGYTTKINTLNEIN